MKYYKYNVFISIQTTNINFYCVQPTDIYVKLSKKMFAVDFSIFISLVFHSEDVSTLHATIKTVTKPAHWYFYLIYYIL